MSLLVIAVGVTATALFIYAVCTTWALWQFSRTLTLHRKELDQLQKFRAYSLLLLETEKDKAEVERVLAKFGLESPWRKSQ